MIFILVVLGILILCLGACLAINIANRDKSIITLCSVFLVILMVLITYALLYGYDSEWTQLDYYYIDTISSGEYYIIVDDECIYKTKNPYEQDIVTIQLGDTATIETESLKEGEYPYVSKEVLYKKYVEYTRYVFYIPEDSDTQTN